MTQARAAGILIAAFGLLRPSISHGSDAPAPAQLAADAAHTQSTTPVPEGATRAADPKPAHRTARTLGWVSLAIGAEAAVVAGVTSVILLNEQGVRSDNCDSQRVCSQRGIDANGSIASLVPWNTAAWIVTAAGLGAGTWLLISTWPKSDSGGDTAITISPSPAGAAVGLRSTF